MHIELSIHSTPKICWQSLGKYITMFPSSFLRVSLLLLLIYSPLLIIQSGYSQLYFTNEISMERKEPAHEIDHRVVWLMSFGCAAFWEEKHLLTSVNENTFFTFPVISFVIMSLSSSLWLMLEKQLVLHTVVRCSLCSDLFAP